MDHHFTSLGSFLSDANAWLAKGAIAIALIEDDVEVDTTLRHLEQIGFAATLVLMPPAFDLPKDLASTAWRIDYDLSPEGAAIAAINQVSEAMTGRWIHYCYNTEYLFFPFCETRSIGEMLAFHTEERRSAMLTYVVDLYSSDLGQDPNAVNLDRAHLDKSGYYALARDLGDGNGPKERQLDFFGGLRWRFEEHVPYARRKIDRISLFKAYPGLQLRDDYTFNDEEYNTFACPWHHNLTAAVCSFRTAKALKLNAGSTFDIHNFTWHNSAPFQWNSGQLMDLGLMEPGQWF